MAFKKIASALVGSGGSAKIQLTSIPQGYKHLIIYASVRTNRSAVNDGFFVYLNGDTANYAAANRLYGSGAGTTGDNGTSVLCPSDTATASSFSNSVIVLPHYAGDKHKAIEAMTQAENNATQAYVSELTYTWRSTSAVTSIELVPETGTAFLQYSSAQVYGID